MSVKTLKRQLAAAIAMVLVAAIALGSSTFAWFANSNKVTADGMQINAQMEGALLLIADTEANLANKKTTLTFSPVKEGEDLFPVHPIYTAGGALTAWNHAFSDTFDTAISNSVETAVDSADYDDYMLATSLWIGLDDTNGAAETGAVTVTGVTLESTDNTLLPSARVLMVVDDKVIGVYGNGQYVSTMGNATTADTLTAIPTAGAGTVIDALTAGDTVEVELYLYFDGRDAACTSKNFKDTAVTCTLEFTAAEA